MRTILIGLGGTGGKVLKNLYDKLDASQKAEAHCLYLDLDKGDTTELISAGIETVCISSSDTVKDVADRLGPNDGVYDWLPMEVNDRRFLASGTDDGASQVRYKSRLCLASFLRNENNKLHNFLKKQCPPGIAIEKDTLRVMIVSSIAGGTGSGTFIDIALYIRKYFRDNNHRDIRITGLFGCPELFMQTLGSKGGDNMKRTAMYANAYAAIRELNALNLAVCKTELPEDVEPTQCTTLTTDYGRSINISIDTVSEGKLFDSNDPSFTDDYNKKPYDLLYFVGLTNEQGGILSSLNQYYSIMADIIYTRQFSKLEDAIRSGESNELNNRSKFPTAIYGSAGYSRIVYPYEDILMYLARRRTRDEMDTKWTIFDDLWQRHCNEQQRLAALTGNTWQATANAREQNFISNMDSHIKNPKSPLRSLRGMLGKEEDDSDDRSVTFLQALDKAMTSSTGLDGTVMIEDGTYSLGTITDVNEYRASIANAFSAAALDEDTDPLKRLQTVSQNFQGDMTIYAHKLLAQLPGKALALASVVFPVDADSEKSAANEKELNLHSGLLCAGGKDIHPLAARYLLYRVRQQMRAYLESRKDVSAKKELENKASLSILAFDEMPFDDDQYTVADKVESIQKNWQFWTKEQIAQAAYDEYLQKIKNALVGMMEEATMELKAQVYTRVLEGLDVLIEQYENLFDNLDQYRSKLDKDVTRDLTKHSAGDDRCLFINASPEDKEQYYRGDIQTVTVLNNSSQEIAAAAGSGVYKALMARTWKHQSDLQTALLMGEDWAQAQAKDTYNDLGYIFENVVSLYANYLKKHATHLQINVMDAVIKECCEQNGLDINKIGVGQEQRGQFCSALSHMMGDLMAKAAPMLGYNEHNTDSYYMQAESVATRYSHISMSSEAEEILSKLFPAADINGSRQMFVDTIQLSNDVLTADKGIVIDKDVSPYELTCFGAVHCLQPTQIYKFREDRTDSYYHYYRARLTEALETRALSMSPHIDKRWHRRDAMPYISRRMEIEWRNKTVKAFLYALLKRELRATTDRNGFHCFVSLRNGRDSLIEWPAGELVLQSRISTLLDYFADQDKLTNELSAKLDAWVKEETGLLANLAHSKPLYKTGMTKSPLLRRMRTSLLTTYSPSSSTTAAHGKNAGAVVSELADKEETATVQETRQALGVKDVAAEETYDLKKNLGGLLEIVWMIHNSELLTDRGSNYAEVLLSAAADIIDQFCRGMYGKNINPKSAMYAEYVDLYNSAVEKVMQEYVVSVARRRKYTGDLLKCSDNTPFYSELRVPDLIRDDAEYLWLQSNWVTKK